LSFRFFAPRLLPFTLAFLLSRQMPSEANPSLPLEIAHVLFIDVVGYSKLLIDDQRELQQQLNQIVRGTEQFRAAEAAGKLVRLPTGDGMALVFFTTPEAPVQCALEISEALQTHPQLRLRMGINTGPVSGVADVNDKSNIAGAGINMAQRVMDIGDAGHILLSKRAAEDLLQYRQWEPHLRDLGEVEVKHGVKISIVNLYTGKLGNPQVPEKVRQFSRKQAATRLVRRVLIVGLLLLAVLAGAFFLRRTTPSLTSNIALIPAKSIAVLPFENLSANQENAFFADGVQDEILTHLAKVADLKVISRTSVMQYKNTAKRNLRDIAGALGVAHVLEGSVQRAANRVRVNAQLIDARSDAHLWAETYDRDLADVFAIQSDIAKTIADHLQARLSPGEKAAIEKPPTTDLRAYDLYLRANDLYANMTDQIRAKEQLPEAMNLLDQAVAADPGFTLAWCLLSQLHGVIYLQGHDHTPARLDLANASVQTALRLQPGAGEPHLALAMHYYRGFRDYDHARSELAIARKTLPNNAEVFFYTGVLGYRIGQWKEATRNLERAIELDPRNVMMIQQLALCYQQQHRYNEEARMWERSLAIVPGDSSSRINRAIVESNSRADMKPYQTTLAALVAQNPSVAPEVDDPFHALRERTATAAARVLENYPRDGVVYYGINYPHAYWEGVVARWQGETAKAQVAFATARAELKKTLEKQPNFPAALSLLGLIDAGLGRKEDALREGRRACELLAMSKDAVDGVAFAVNLAQIYAWVGEKDLAIQQLAAPLKVPTDLHYGELRLHPFWDPLRGDPRFEKIVASQAPKD
jgi:TolB-like protein/class 3 adenylate cyclase/Flp pilus assembly protein TadD